MKARYINILIALVIAITSISINGRVFAYNEFYSSNDVLFYDEKDTGCSSTGIIGTDTTNNTDIKYTLPATTGRAGNEESINASGQIPSGGKVTFSQHAARGKAYQDYYITMRWNYVSWNWNGTSRDTDNEQYNWFAEKPRIVLVTNQTNGKSIYAVALEAGPAPWTGVDKSSNNNPKLGWVNPQKGTPPEYTGRVAGFPPVAKDALDFKQGMSNGTGDILTYQWASDQNVTPGPTGDTASVGVNSNCNPSAAGEYGWDLDGANAMVFYDQLSTDWKEKMFGAGRIGECGCGPTSLAMIVATLTGDKSVNPENMAKFYAANGGVDSGSCGSSWNWSVIENQYKVNVESIGTNLDKAKESLRNGNLVLFSWQGAPFTNGGHIMVMRKYSPDGKIYIASSGGRLNKEQSNQAWDESVFTTTYNGPVERGQVKTGHLKGMWSIEKK